MQADDELERLRAAMDEVNGRLAAVLHERARLCRRIGRCKRAQGLPAIDPEREAAMLAAFAGPLLDDGFPRDALHRIFAQVLAESRRLVERG